MKSRALADGWDPAQLEAFVRGVRQAKGGQATPGQLRYALARHKREVAQLADELGKVGRAPRRRARVADPRGEGSRSWGVHVGEVADAGGVGASMGSMTEMVAEAADAIYALGRRSSGVVLVRVVGETALGGAFQGAHDADVGSREAVEGAVMRAIYRALRGGSAGRAGGVGLSAGRRRRGGRRGRAAPSGDYVSRLAVDVVPLAGGA